MGMPISDEWCVLDETADIYSQRIQSDVDMKETILSLDLGNHSEGGFEILPPQQSFASLALPSALPANVPNAFGTLMANANKQSTASSARKLKRAGSSLSTQPSRPRLAITDNSETSTVTRRATFEISAARDVSSHTAGGRGRGRGSARAGGRSRFSAPPTTTPRPAPPYKLVRGAGISQPIVVDGFQYAHSSLSSCYFLTHFHSDHYGGLTKRFDA
eukprot:gene7409-9494_t